MITWFVAEDIKWYQDYSWWKKFINTNGQLIKQKNIVTTEDNNNHLLIVPDENLIMEYLNKGINFDVLSYTYPFSKLRDIFVMHYLENAYQYLTTQEYMYMCSMNKEEQDKFRRRKLEDKLGLKIYQPKLSHDDMVGLVGIKRFIYRVKLIKDEKLKPKGIFLVGVPGTGKSFSAKYAASLLDYYLVEMNVAKIIESENAVEILHRIFKYLEDFTQTQGKGVVLWIDEIEKMFAGMQSDTSTKRVFGQLLTILNDFNTETGYKIHGIFWVTANNIKDIVENNPEFLRKGRFDELFFVDTPSFEDSKKMFALYKNKFPFKYMVRRFSSFEEEIVDYIQTIYSLESSKYGAKDVTKFIYTPAEIENITKELSIRFLLKQQYATNREKDLLRLLYSKREFVQIGMYIKTIEYYDTDYEKFLSKVSNHIIKKPDIDIVDITYVVVRNDPLTIRLRESIAYMRSQEKFFTPAD